jgi:hypothetical protein
MNDDNIFIKCLIDNAPPTSPPPNYVYTFILCCPSDRHIFQLLNYKIMFADYFLCQIVNGYGTQISGLFLFHAVHSIIHISFLFVVSLFYSYMLKLMNNK